MADTKKKLEQQIEEIHAIFNEHDDAEEIVKRIRAVLYNSPAKAGRGGKVEDDEDEPENGEKEVD